jgi:glutamyl-tRNA reductase
VLIVGAGEMGTVVSKALLEKQTNAIVVANRTYDKAQELAKELDGIAIKFKSMDENLHKIDVLISATGAPHTLINKKRLEVLPQEHLENMIMLDLANPRDIDDDVRELNVQLYNIDDLRYVTDKNKKKREEEAVKAEAIIEEETVLLKNALKQLEISPILSSLNVEAEKIRKQELDKTLNMLDLSDKEVIILNQLTHSIVDKLMFDIIKNLKTAANENDDQTIKSAKKLFNTNNKK